MSVNTMEIISQVSGYLFRQLCGGENVGPIKVKTILQYCPNLSWKQVESVCKHLEKWHIIEHCVYNRAPQTLCYFETFDFEKGSGSKYSFSPNTHMLLNQKWTPKDVLNCKEKLHILWGLWKKKIRFENNHLVPYRPFLLLTSSHIIEEWIVNHASKVVRVIYVDDTHETKSEDKAHLKDLWKRYRLDEEQHVYKKILYDGRAFMNEVLFGDLCLQKNRFKEFDELDDLARYLCEVCSLTTPYL